MSSSSVFERLVFAGRAALAGERVRVAMDPKNALLGGRGQEPCEAGKLCERNADRPVVPDDELLTGVGPPTDVRDARGEDARQALGEETVRCRGPAQARTDDRPEKGHQLGA